VLDIDNGDNQQVAIVGLEKKASKVSQGIVQAIPIIFSSVCGVIAFFAWIFHFVSLAGVAWCVILGVAVILGIGTGVGMTFYYGSMSKQLKRFKAENDRLESTT